MGGCRCSYKNCPNTTKTTENVHFFHYPVKHKERCKIWTENANKPQFCDLEEDQLRNKVICEHHFEDKWFPNSQKKRLLQGAIPTLDWGSDEEEMEHENMFVSTGLQEIQILPASSDGSLFILDTDSIYNRSKNVESFVYKNGFIVPTSIPNEMKQEVINSKLPISKPKPSTSRVNFSQQKSSSAPMQKVDLEDPLEFKFSVKKETPDFEIFPGKSSHQIEFENRPEPAPSTTFMESPKRNVPTAVKTSPITKQSEKANLAKNYLRKIKQHSRDIANIKKMLRQKAMSQAKLDTEQILESVKGSVPPSLFSVLNLNINSNYELTEEDEEFFSTIHDVSPEVYDLLVEKYNWNLPSIADTPLE